MKPGDVLRAEAERSDRRWRRYLAHGPATLARHFELRARLFDRVAETADRCARVAEDVDLRNVLGRSVVESSEPRSAYDADGALPGSEGPTP